jgi:hypothetical protein
MAPRSPRPSWRCSSVGCLSAPGVAAGKRLSWVSVPSSRPQQEESTYPGDSQLPVRSALRFSQPLGGLLLFLPRGLVSCRNRVQGSALQGFSLQGSRLTSSDRLALMALAPELLTIAVASDGAQPARSPPGPSSTRGVRLPCAAVRPSQGPVPLMGFRPLPGSPSSCRGDGFPSPPLMPLAPGLSTPKGFIPLAGLQRLAEQEARLASFESCRPA